MNQILVDTVVIGAGPAGLTAAYELAKQGKNVVVLEESEKIGGISQTIKYKNNRIDIGGHRFFSKDERVMEWWKGIFPFQGAPSKDDKILGREAAIVEGGPDPESEDEVFLIRHRVSRIYYKGKFFDYPVSFKPATFINMGFGTSVKAGFSYIKSSIKKLPEDSLENFYINRFGRVLYSMFFKYYTEKVWGRSPKFISADWGAQRVKGLSIAALIKNVFKKIGKSKNVETSLIEQFYYPKYGPGQLWEAVAQRIGDYGGRIIFSQKVVSLANDGKNITKVVCENGREFLCNNVISSMPLKELTPALGCSNAEISKIAKNLPYRDFITVGLLVDKLKLVNKTKIKTLGNIVPDCWIYIQEPGVKIGRIQIFNNWSPYMVGNPEKEVWVGLEYFCNEGDEQWSMDDDSFIQMAIGELKKIGILSDDTEIKDSYRAKIKKAYPAYFDSYKDIDKLIDYLNGFENLYCVGRNGQHRYNNMDHSMATAFMAVDAINGKADKKDIWNVNTEKEYHESK